MITKYGPTEPAKRVYTGRRTEDLLEAVREFCRFGLFGGLLGVYIPAGADALECRAYQTEGIMKSPACRILGVERLFYLLGAKAEREDLLCLPVGALVSERGVKVFLLACWDEEDAEFRFEVTRCHPLATDAEVSFFDCATAALVDLYVDRMPSPPRPDPEADADR